MSVDFRLLGEVEGYVNGRLIDVGHAQQRCVLVALLIEANRTVSVDDLVDRVWAGRRRPSHPVNALRTYLSLLRGAISAAGDEVVIARQAQGYRLSVDTDAVDLHRFHGLVDRARTEQNDVAAAKLLEQALGLWRGEPFTDLDALWLDTIRTTLVQQRHAAWLDLNDIRLRGGDHASLLPQLSDHVAEHPLDERLRAQYMLALHRTGKQTDALAQFEQIRRQLADELGIDPGSELQQLYQRILSADSSLDLGAAVAPRSAPYVIPRQLPPAPCLFAGRDDELRTLDAMLPSSGELGAVAIMAIQGSGGIGKTLLALNWAHRNVGLFPDGQLYVNLRGFDPSGEPRSPGDVVRGFLEALGVSPAAVPIDVDAQVALYRSLVAGKRMLIVLDNARDTAQAVPLLPGDSSCAVLVTSRHELTGLVSAHGAFRLKLGVLPDTDAGALLERRLGPIRVGDEPGAVAELLAYCGGLPLALSIVAARADAHPDFPLQTLAEELREMSTRLGALDAGELTTSLTAVLSSSYHALDEEAARAFGLLGLAPCPDISLSAAASLTGLPAARVRTVLRRLENAHLLQEHVPARYRMHDLIRLYAAECADKDQPDDVRAASLRRLADFYVHTAHAATLLLDPYQELPPIALAPPDPAVVPDGLDSRDQALEWFAAEKAGLLSVVYRAADAGLDAHAWQLAWAVTDYFDLKGCWQDLSAVQRVALVTAQCRPGPAGRDAMAHSYRALGRACARLGRLDESDEHFRRALTLFAELGSPAGEARSRLGLARVAELRAHYREALDHALLALDLLRDTGHPEWEARATNVVAWSYIQVGEHKRALDYCRQALTLFRGLDDPHGEANSWDTLGYAHHHLGRHRQAVPCHQRAIAIYREIGDRYYQATTEMHLADAHLAHGDQDAARSAWYRALRILDELGHPDADQVRTRLNRPAVPSPAREQDSALTGGFT
jgi:DNA-binding SARP family transcriptional activator/tetratricopeptide (TPR) repeat protein